MHTSLGRHNITIILGKVIVPSMVQWNLIEYNLKGEGLAIISIRQLGYLLDI